MADQAGADGEPPGGGGAAPRASQPAGGSASSSGGAAPWSRAAPPRVGGRDAQPAVGEVDGLAALDQQGGPTPAFEKWDPGRFEHVALLQQALRNQGYVDLCFDREARRHVAVKVMPASWVCESHEAFVATHTDENELPWRDIGATYYLSRVAGLPCVCDFVGLFKRQSSEHGEEVCMVLSYCEGGDLFSLLERSLSVVGAGRESLTRPLMRKVVQAVRDVHARGLSHGDLSLENVLLAIPLEEDPEAAVVKLIDFGACGGRRVRGVRGKPSYQAPEAHAGEDYDALAADAFSVGVMIFTLAVGNYPWKSTRPHVCPCWKFSASSGLDAYLARRKIGGPSGEVVSLKELLSPELVTLLEGLLAPDAASRLDMSAALEMPWFSGSCG